MEFKKNNSCGGDDDSDSDSEDDSDSDDDDEDGGCGNSELKRVVNFICS